MNPNHPSDIEWQRLLAGAVDGILTESEERQLAEILKASHDARRDYLAAMELSATLEWTYAEAACEPVTPPRPAHRRAMATALAAAAVVALAGWALVLFDSTTPAAAPAPERVAQLDFVMGGFTWTGPDGIAVSQLQPGDPLPTGTLALESEVGLAQLRFDDGTVITLTGEAELSLAAHPGKTLTLRRGHLSADVEKQDPENPLRILTPTAGLEVLGTTLAVSADDESTSLDVAEGLVRMRRLADGKTVQVPGKHRAIASLDTSQELAARPPESLPLEWTADLTGNNTHFSKGILTADAATGEPCVANEVYRAGRRADGSILPRYGICLKESPRDPPFVELSAKTVVHLRYRSEAAPDIMLLTARSDGRFGGNFEFDVASHGEDRDPTRWRTVVVPLEDFRIQDRPWSDNPGPIGKQVRKVLVSNAADGGLEVGHFSIGTR